MTFFKYEVNYWEDIDGIDVTCRGYTVGETYAEAAAKIAKYYGDTAINSLTLEATDMEDGVLEMSNTRAD